MKLLKSKSFIGTFIISFIAIFVISYFLFRQNSLLNPGQDTVAEAGVSLPNFAFKNFDGKEFELKDFKGEVILISFWASWCEPCKEELPAFQKLKETLNNDKFKILAINLDSNMEDGKQFFDTLKKSHSLNFETYFDPQNNAARTLNLESLPANILMNKEGKEVFLSYGLQDWSSSHLVEMFKAELN